jgi:Cof subfamily protein (haloacid dehalogenase superfamily)
VDKWSITFAIVAFSDLSFIFQTKDVMSDEARYRMVCIDLDGTLLCPRGTVTERVRSAIHSALKAGLLVCFATGRNWTESKTVLEAVDHYDSAVFVGGAMVVDTKNEVMLHRTMMQPSLAAELCDVFERNGHAVLALQDTGTAGVDYVVSADIPVNKETARWMSHTKASLHRVPRLAEYSHQHTIRVGIVAEPSETARLKAELEEQFGERIFMQAIRVPTANVDVLEIFDPAVNKWQGILHVARRHEIEPSQIIAIGDDLNDLAMISSAGLGVAMGNARPEVKEIADLVIKANHEEGLAEFLEELVQRHIVEPEVQPTDGPIDDTEAA